MSRRRVAVTGLGIIAPVGIGLDACWRNILDGRSGISKISRFDASAFPSQIAGEVKGFDVTHYLSGKEARRYDTFIHYGLVATMEAVKDAGLEGFGGDKERVGVCIGSGIGGLPMIEETHAKYVQGGLHKISPVFVPSTMFCYGEDTVSRPVTPRGAGSPSRPAVRPRRSHQTGGDDTPERQTRSTIYSLCETSPPCRTS
jgi:3-oxoacyl-(acyl-carrier-protein) synthase